jgi:hypothetical protein
MLGYPLLCVCCTITSSLLDNSDLNDITHHSSLILSMCRNIKTLYNFDPPATDDEIRASAVQFVRKLSGFTKPSKANEEAFHRAVDEVTIVARELIDSLTTKAAPRNREVEKQKLIERSAKRFGKPVPKVAS